MNATAWQKSTFSGGGDGDTCTELAAGPAALADLLRTFKADAR